MVIEEKQRAMDTVFENFDIMNNIYRYLTLEEISFFLIRKKGDNIPSTAQIHFKNLLKRVTCTKKCLVQNSYLGYHPPRLFSSFLLKMREKNLTVWFKCYLTGKIEMCPFYSLSKLESFFHIQNRIKRSCLFQQKKELLNKNIINKYFISLGYVVPWWEKVNYCVGEKIDVMDNQGIWYEGIIIEFKKNERIKIHYRQWNQTFDQFFYFKETEKNNSILHIAPAYTFVSKWRDNLQPNMILEYVNPVSRLWYNGVIQPTNLICQSHIKSHCNGFFIRPFYSSQSHSHPIVMYHPDDSSIAPLGIHTRDCPSSYFNDHFFWSKTYKNDNGSVSVFAEITFSKGNKHDIRFISGPINEEAMVSSDFNELSFFEKHLSLLKKS